jgi:hypothetical protein
MDLDVLLKAFVCTGLLCLCIVMVLLWIDDQ